jgi:hypothetical protein
MQTRQTSAKVTELLATDIAAADLDELTALLREIIRDIPLTGPVFDPGLTVFRGVECDSAETVQRLSYPPAHLVRMGRANLSGRRLFYASAARPPVFFELKARPGTTLLISKWRTTAPAMLNHLGYHRSVFEAMGSRRDIPSWDGRHEAHPNTEDYSIRVLPCKETQTTSHSKPSGSTLI